MEAKTALVEMDSRALHESDLWLSSNKDNVCSTTAGTEGEQLSSYNDWDRLELRVCGAP